MKPWYLNSAFTQVVKLVRVCQLGSSQLEEEGRRELWFPLLDSLLSMQPPLASHSKLGGEVRSMVGHVVNSMITHVSLHAILERVMRDPGYCGGNFAQIKHLLKGEVFLHHKTDATFGWLHSLTSKQQWHVQVLWTSTIRIYYCKPEAIFFLSFCGPVSFSLHRIASTVIILQSRVET